MLDFFPGLERWMFVELLDVAGNKLMHSIANKFIEAPYEYRRGWPDITMWKNGELRFVEVKAPGDKVRDSQKKIITEFSKPLGLSFFLAGVRDEEA
ncbi:MAG: VRR-NUC domain-containing protein [Methylococcales bacterium]